MKVVVIGGTGLIGSNLVKKLRGHGHESVPAAPNTGVNTLTGEGLNEALAGADVVVDVSNSPSFEDAAVLEFFETSTRNILQVEAATGVGHHVALSVVGSDRISDSGYMRAKDAQEKLIKSSGIPYTIVHATQFFEFATRIADGASDGDTSAAPGRIDSTDGSRRRRRRGVRGGAGRAPEQHRRDRRPRIDAVRGLRPTGLARRRGRTRRCRRSSGSVLRSATQ